MIKMILKIAFEKKFFKKKVFKCKHEKINDFNSKNPN